MTTPFAYSHGAVVRGPTDAKRLALVFTGGDFGEGLPTVLRALDATGAPGSFFLTGGFLAEPSNRAGIQDLVGAGHYVGPHSAAHLLYCPWEERSRTLVSREEFVHDIEDNLAALARFGVPRSRVTWWIPPFEWYNEQIAAWARDLGLPLFCFTPGTLSHADYTEDDAPNYRSSDTIHRSILDYERARPDGLNGFLLLTHVGAGPRRTDKFFLRLERLVGELSGRGYEFASVPGLLAGKEHAC